AAAFVAGVLHRGRVPQILVPTTVMAIADVIVGSKTGVNYVHADGDLVFKNVIGIYENPAAVLLDRTFIDTLPNVHRRIGLSEVVKHALLQDPMLLDKALAGLEQQELPARTAVDLALRAMDLKRAVLGVDPWEESV